uniref:Drebrin n=1 Tax=Naja naja TaxID=35670 RepID=A0A8C6Y3X2_NAJNA
MAGVSFSVNRLELLASYQEVIGEDSPTDWALYTYEEDSDNLKLAASGTGGLQELSSHFENQKVMYGFCSVKDPQATLPKYVLVNWVGEDVADARKCACASHVAKIAEFFQGVDVIVNASSVEDIDPGAIGQRLSNGLARIASPVLHRLRLREDENAQPVGTVYQKTDAAVEMKRLNREQFWEQAKKEEELRKEEERKKALDERLRFEQERMEQERQEQEEREKRYREREEQIEEHRRKQQSLEAEEAKQRLKEQSIFGEQEDDEDRQQPKKSESEVEEAAAIIAQRPENPREFFRQQERVASASSETPSPFNRTGRLHCPFIKTPDSGPPSSSSSSSSPPRTPFPYITCHRTPNLSSFFPCSQTETHRKASASASSPCDSSTASTPVGEQIERALDEVTQQDALKEPQPSGTGPVEDVVLPESKEEPLFPVAPPPKEEPQFPAAPVSVQSEEALDLGEAFGFSQPPAPPSENILDLWQNDSTVAEPNPPDPPSSAGLPEDNLLNFNDLPEPPATFCDADQDEEPASMIAVEGLHQMTLSYQHALQEASGVPQEPQLLTNGETAQKESTQVSEGYFSQSQDEDFNQSEELSAKAPPPVFYNKPPGRLWDL